MVGTFVPTAEGFMGIVFPSTYGWKLLGLRLL
jgi:hypothetical protein